MCLYFDECRRDVSAGPTARAHSFASSEKRCSPRSGANKLAVIKCKLSPQLCAQAPSGDAPRKVRDLVLFVKRVLVSPERNSREQFHSIVQMGSSIGLGWN